MPERPTTSGGTTNSWLLAAASAGAGLIHVSVIIGHGDVLMSVAFALTAWFQLATAYLILRRPTSRDLIGAMAVGNLVALAGWALSRTTGLPFGLHDGEPEAAAALDLVAAGLQAFVVVLALGTLGAHRSVSRQVAFAGSGALLALATVAIIVPPGGTDTTTVGGSAASSGGDGHGHSHGGDAAAAGSLDDHAAQMLDLDRSRCDLGFNPQAYWDETRAMGVDTYAGGAMSMADHGGNAITQVASATQLGGRGSEHFDQLMSLASQSGGEVAGARFIAALSDATQAEYDAFRAWARANAGEGGHDHGSQPDEEDDGSIEPVLTMGHVSPSTWTAMVDPVQCQRLAEELELARETATRWPTAADAMEDGYRLVAPYLPGIASHFMRFANVDGTFEITEPEMLLFDGNGPEARIVGLSYYIQLEGDAQPTQGFTGDNDHYHRHFGLCISPRGGVIGDSSTTDAECEAAGGYKSEGTAGWMSHAWVVPGCESPWGVFSGINPLLDHHLGAASGESEGCAASGVRDRYDLSPGASDLLVTGPSSELAADDG